MTAHSPGRIYLADQRGVREENGFRTFYTFNSRYYHHAYREPFGRLAALDDETLAGNSSIRWQVGGGNYAVFLPVVGTILVKDAAGKDHIVRPSTLQAFYVPVDTSFEIINPYEEPVELVNYIRIIISADRAYDDTFSTVLWFDISTKDRLSAQRLREAAVFSLGKFNGRADALYRPRSAVYAFVIQGAFEVQGRLLHPRDGLALWDVEEVDMEALSNDAIILLIE